MSYTMTMISPRSQLASLQTAQADALREDSKSFATRVGGGGSLSNQLDNNTLRWSDGGSDWPGLCLFCYQPSCVVSQQS